MCLSHIQHSVCSSDKTFSKMAANLVSVKKKFAFMFSFNFFVESLNASFQIIFCSLKCDDTFKHIHDMFAYKKRVYILCFYNYNLASSHLLTIHFQFSPLVASFLFLFHVSVTMLEHFICNKNFGFFAVRKVCTV